MTPTRRGFLACGLAGSLAAPLVRGAPAADRPNVLVVVLDDLGCHDLGYLGAADLKTPNIDAIAARGLKFRNWYSNARLRPCALRDPDRPLPRVGRRAR